MDVDKDGRLMLYISRNDSVLICDTESMYSLRRSALLFVNIGRYFLVQNCRYLRTLRWSGMKTMKITTPRNELNKCLRLNRKLLGKNEYRISKTQGIPVMRNSFDAILILKNSHICVKNQLMSQPGVQGTQYVD